MVDSVFHPVFLSSFLNQIVLKREIYLRKIKVKLE